MRRAQRAHGAPRAASGSTGKAVACTTCVAAAGDRAVARLHAELREQAAQLLALRSAHDALVATSRSDRLLYEHAASALGTQLVQLREARASLAVRGRR